MMNLSVKIGLLILGLGLIFPVVASATTILEDNFNSYNLGDLGGQGGWATTTALSPQITGDDKIEGSKGVKGVPDIATRVYKMGTSLASGEITIYVKHPDAGTFSYGTTFVVSNTADMSQTCGMKWYQDWGSEVQFGLVALPSVSYIQTYTGTLGIWYKAKISWWGEGTIRCRLDIQGSSNSTNNPTFTGADRVFLDSTTPTKLHYYDYISELGTLIYPSTIEITNPVSGSTASSTFIADVSYNTRSEGWDKIMVIFENWEASSTCPVYGTSEWYDEYDLGYFNYQSFPFFSDTLATTTGTTTIDVENLDENSYNCVRCFFLNEASSTLSGEKCDTYTLTISGFIPPSQPLPIKKWSDYYAIHSDPKYSTSTEIFNTITGSFDTIVQKVGSFLIDFRVIFDQKQAETKGTDLGSKVPLARGYLKPINDFFGGSLPVSEFFIFALLILIIIGVFRMVKIIVQFIRG